MMTRLAAILLALVWLPALALAQAAPATLIADKVSIEGDNRLLASGNVEVIYDGYVLQADKVEYDRDADRLSITGQMRLTTADGTILLADSAELAPDLSEGLMRSARLVLEQQLQLAAAEIRRAQGRYTVLEKTVASSCQVCAARPVPLWQIRARRVIHDAQEQQLYFDHARLEVMGVPILYLPRLRLPDPSLKRATGFLVPKVRITDKLGTGVKLPYFITMGQSADLTVTPYLSTGSTRTAELRYRQAFGSGEIELNGALSRDTLRQGETRRYLFAEGQFDLPRDFTLDFALRTVSDPAYLLDYSYSDTDRLASRADITRTRHDEYLGAGLIYYNSLRASESNLTLPSTLLTGDWQRRFEPAGLGGILTTRAEVFAFNRRSTADVTGRDMARLSGQIDWRRGWTLRNGMLLSAQGALALDYYTIGDDSTSDASVARTAPFVAAELRWPMLRAGAGGVAHVLEPVVQLVWSNDSSAAIPNEDSLSAEFDEGNLYSLSRFAGADAYEQGGRANIGITYTRLSPSGWSLGATAGRILRTQALTQFAAGSGLDGARSDWLAAVQLTTPGNLRLTNRAVFNDGLNFTRNELRLDWRNDDLAVASSLIWQEANPIEARPTDTSEWLMDASYRFRSDWTGKADWRYDIVNERAARAGVGLEYRNECVTVDVSLSRRFTSSTSVTPTTDFGLTISLAGFGAGAQARPAAARCTR